MNAAIAQHLNVIESAIIRVEEWSKVLFVVVRNVGARFVSKKVVKVEIPTSKSGEIFGSIFDFIPNRPGAVQLKRIEDVGESYNVTYEQKGEAYIQEISKADALKGVAKLHEATKKAASVAALQKPSIAKNGAFYIEVKAGSVAVGQEVQVNHKGSKTSAKVKSLGKVYEVDSYAIASNLPAGSDSYDDGDFVEAGKAIVQRAYLVIA